MSISPQDLLSWAKRLLAGAASETELRDTISRAYYAAFHEARHFHDTLPAKGQAPRKRVGIHAKLSHRLQNPSLPRSDERYRRSQVLGHHLKFLHARRVEADYRLDVDIDRAKVERIVERVDRVFELCAGS